MSNATDAIYNAGLSNGTDNAEFWYMANGMYSTRDGNLGGYPTLTIYAKGNDVVRRDIYNGSGDRSSTGSFTVTGYYGKFVTQSYNSGWRNTFSILRDCTAYYNGNKLQLSAGDTTSINVKQWVPNNVVLILMKPNK